MTSQMKNQHGEQEVFSLNAISVKHAARSVKRLH